MFVCDDDDSDNNDKNDDNNGSGFKMMMMVLVVTMMTNVDEAYTCTVCRYPGTHPTCNLYYEKRLNIFQIASIFFF